MLVLGIESSCDETGVALYDTERGLLAHHLHTQMAMHAEYGGVVPELASRDHIRRVVPLTQGCLQEAGVSYDDIDAVAYTQGPGLGGALLAGSGYANALAFALNKPVIPIHHLEGHLLPAFGGRQTRISVRRPAGFGRAYAVYGGARYRRLHADGRKC